MARDNQKSSLRVMRSQCTFPCVVRACARDPHTKDTGGGDEGTVVLAPLGMGRPAAWLSAQYHAQSPPSRKKRSDTQHTDWSAPKSTRTQSGLTRARNTQCTAQGRARLETRQTCVGTTVWVLRLPKTTLQKTRFRSVNNYKEFAYR